MQQEINLRDNQIQVLKLKLAELQKNLDEKAGQEEKQGPPANQSFRALQVADMTTFMAKLLQKLTEMSCNHANQFIGEQNEFLSALHNDVQKIQFESKINDDIPITFCKPFEFSDVDRIHFESNTQLLTDETLNIADLVSQLQALAKKHNSSLNALAQQSLISVKIRKRATQLEKESLFTHSRLRKSIQENAELLLNELFTHHRDTQEMPKYMQTLLAKLQDVDNDFKNRIFHRARDISKQEY